VYKRRFS